ncbi:MAG: DUF4437 domain-containing protein [Acidobacteriota bacterium]
MPVSAVQWEALNPARGDQSPKAGTLWGDRDGEVPTGFLAQFVDGFSSPPHIHNVTYRAVVIDGLIHNDDPDAAKMWMPAGSFWTQPEGESHITAAKGERNVALVEIDTGPYLVRPPEDHFDSGERPINVVPSNIVWVDVPGTADHAEGPQIAYLWGGLESDRENGTFLKLPAGWSGSIHTQAPTFRAVVVKGELRHARHPDGALPPGSYFGSTGDATHALTSASGSLIYLRTVGRYDLVDQGQ